jgi:hypothetical protein
MHVAAPGARQKRLSRLVTSQVEGALRLTLIGNDDMTGSASHRTPALPRGCYLAAMLGAGRGRDGRTGN